MIPFLWLGHQTNNPCILSERCHLFSRTGYFHNHDFLNKQCDLSSKSNALVHTRIYFTTGTTLLWFCLQRAHRNCTHPQTDPQHYRCVSTYTHTHTHSCARSFHIHLFFFKIPRKRLFKNLCQTVLIWKEIHFVYDISRQPKCSREVKHRVGTRHGSHSKVHQ